MQHVVVFCREAVVLQESNFFNLRLYWCNIFLIYDLRQSKGILSEIEN